MPARYASLPGNPSIVKKLVLFQEFFVSFLRFPSKRRISIFFVYLQSMSEFKTNKAVFVGVILEKGGERKVQEYLDELAFLAETAGAIPDKMFTQRLDRPDKATYIGPGKLDEIKEYCQANEIEYVIFDDELTGMQQRNIEKVIAPALFWKSLPSGPRPPMPRCRWNWRITTICSPAWPVCGRTWSGSAVVWVRAAVWVKPRSKSTAVL